MAGRELIVEIIGDTKEFDAAMARAAGEITKIGGLAEAMERPLNGLRDAALVAAMALKGVTLDNSNVSSTVAAAAVMGRALDSIRDKALVAKLALSSMGGGFLGGGGIGKLLWGGLLGHGGIGGIGAGFGSLGGLAGFGVERIVGTALSVAGSAIGAILGGIVLGLGAVGTAAVGMLTDMAGMAQAASDVKSVSKAMDALQTAQQQFGKNSAQAAAAQLALNQALAGIQPVARQAVEAAAKTQLAFEQMFHNVTGVATKIGAQILNQAMQVGMKFLPTIGKFAGQNLKIIQAQLQPFFKWLADPAFSGPGRGGGLGIFTNLEKIFQRNLPTGVHAFEQGFELLIKTVDLAAQHLGHFMQIVNELLTRLNGPDFNKYAHGINVLITQFDIWVKLLYEAGRAIFFLFKPASGQADDLLRKITALEKGIGDFLSAKGTQDKLRALFAAHKAQLDAIWNALKPILPVLGKLILLFIKVETEVTRGSIPAIKALGAVIAFLTNPVRNVNNAFSKLFGYIRSGMQAAGHAFAPVIGALAMVVHLLEEAIGLAQKVASAVSHIHIPGGGGIPGSVLGAIPGLGGLGGLFHAKGGIFNSPTLGIIGEAGPEAVIPLNRAGGMLGGVTVHIGHVHGTADADFATRLASQLATQLRGGRVPSLQQAIRAL